MKRILSSVLVICIALSALLAFTSCSPKCAHGDELGLRSTTATCTAPGTETYYCYQCDADVETKEVEAYGHIYVTDNELGNRKCKYCDLLQYSVTLKNVPETITVYRKTNSSATGKVHSSTVTVNSVSWSVDMDDLNVTIDVTPTFLANNEEIMFAYKLTKSDGTVMIGFQAATSYTKLDEPTKLTDSNRRNNLDKIDDFNYLLHDNETQYSYELEIYEVFTYEAPYGAPIFFEGTFATPKN